MMQVVHSIAELKQIIKPYKQAGKTVGFVPTMGALHAGHLELARQAASQNDLTVMSIFVNPTQFGPNEDFERYPRDLEKDVTLAQSAGVDIVFAPSVKEMYPVKAGQILANTPKIGRVLCGKSRKGHFNGVVLVVTKLFHIVEPTRAYFGAKDFQQSVIIQRMVAEWLFDIQIIVVPTLRDYDGLALSSRNIYLSPYQRQHAPVLYQMLKQIQEQAENERRVSRLLQDALILINPLKSDAKLDIRLDYFEIVSVTNLQKQKSVNENSYAVIACYWGKTRLIDNIKLLD